MNKTMNKKQRFTPKGTCPVCHESFKVSAVLMEGHGYLDCPNCWESLKIISTSPLKLMPASSTREHAGSHKDFDFDDDFYDEYEDN